MLRYQKPRNRSCRGLVGGSVPFDCLSDSSCTCTRAFLSADSVWSTRGPDEVASGPSSAVDMVARVIFSQPVGRGSWQKEKCGIREEEEGSSQWKGLEGTRRKRMVLRQRDPALPAGSYQLL